MIMQNKFLIKSPEIKALVKCPRRIGLDKL